MNDWKDGLPGVGVVCEGYISVSPAPAFKWVTVEILKNTGFECAVYNEDTGRLSWCDQFRPIKKREPKPGEVWLCGSLQVPCVMSNTGDLYPFPLIELNGSNSFPIDASGLEYTAPSVKVHIARELLRDAKSKTEDSGQAINTEGWKLLKQEARLDEE